MPTNLAPQEALSAIAEGDGPVLQRLALMNLDSLQDSGLDQRTYFLVRLGALIGMDAAPMSYAVNLSLAAESGVTFEDARGVFVAISPIVGSARLVSAAGGTLRAFGLMIEDQNGQA
jgi:hypothetical protein